ncbi:MAG TPA: hypothetical protein VK905_03905 [Bacillota bacterium]|nr:hypothetical protein [Bacillota bacterium]
MSEKKALNRREFITKGGLAVAGATLAVSGLSAVLTGCAPQQAETPTPPPPAPPVQPEMLEWPLKWTKLDVEKVTERSYASYMQSG